MSNIFGKSNTITLKTTQSDFNENDTGSISFINNRPVVGDGGLTEKNFTSGFNDKLTAISNNADVNVQSDFSQTDASADDYIKNPPVVASETAAGLIKIGYTGSGKNYPVLLASEKAYVSVPWDNKLTATQVQTAMNTIIEKQADTNKILIKYDGSTKMTLSDTLASFTTTELGGNTLVCDTTIRSNQVTTATTGDFVLQRNTTPKLTFGNAKTTSSQDFHIGTGYNTLTASERSDLVVCGDTYIKGGTTMGGGSNEITTKANLVVHYTDTNSGADRGNTTNTTSDKRYLHFGTGGVGTTGGGTWNDYAIYSHGPILTNSYIVVLDAVPGASDDRIKTEEVDITNSTETLMLLRPKNYYKHPTYRVSEDDESAIPEKDLSGNFIEKYWESGLIAQSVEQIDELKHLVGDIKVEGNDLKVLNYTGLIPYLVRSNQELNERIKQLEIKSNV